MRRLALTLILALTTPAPAQPSPTSGLRIFIAGDSTAQDYRPDRYPQSGWGTMLRCAVDVPVENRAIGGRSTRSFIEQGRLDAIARDIRAGDTLLIQFGHNDADTRKMAERHTPIPDYMINLRRFIAVARDAGAQPVLITPITQRRFKDGHVPRSFPLYEDAARQVGTETRTPLIDLAAASRRWVETAGDARSRRYYLHLTKADAAPGFPDGIIDDTHLSEIGARGAAAIVARDLARLRLPVSRHVHQARAPTTALGSSACA